MARQIVVGGISGLTATTLVLGIIVARFTTSTRQSAITVIAIVAIVGALLGGFLAAPSLKRLTWDDGIEGQDGESSPTLRFPE